MNEMVSLFVQAIQDYYGAYESAVMADDVARWVGWEYIASLDNLNVLLDAVKAYQAVRHGPPDVATIRYALKAWEESGHRKVERVRAPDYHAILPSTEEIRQENEAIKAKARSLGINVDRPGWMMRMTQLCMASGGDMSALMRSRGLPSGLRLDGEVGSGRFPGDPQGVR